jgi:hypothetical protein
MAKITPLFQAVTARFHAAALRELFSLPDLDRVLGSVAFVRLDGVNCIAKQLEDVADIATFYIGIRNDITSVQAVRRLIELGVKVIAIDTASRSTLFHPKIYLAKYGQVVQLIIGSANLTYSGMHNNVEAGAIVTLDLDDPEDKVFLDSMVSGVADLPTKHPDNAFEIKTVADADALFDQGRLADEDVVIAPAVKSKSTPAKRDGVKAMKLHWHAPPARKRRKVVILPTTPAAVPVPVPADATTSEDFTLIWESKGLTERDLNIPRGHGTHATGSMLWKKGAVDDIDQRKFFRNEAFAGLDWAVDPKLPHYVRTHAKFQLVVKGVDYGVYNLKLSHNTRTDTETYAQKNAITQVHWGTAMKIIAKRDLLGRIMSLYRKEGTPPEFMIEID